MKTPQLAAPWSQHGEALASSWVIVGRSRAGTEEIDTAETKAEASRLLGEYRIALGEGWSLWIEARP